jgi:chemotaxis methyl-accepting protein methylase
MTEPDPDPALLALFERIDQACGLDCDGYKQSCLRRRLAVRMRACGVGTYQEYAAVLDEDSAEYGRLLETITINVTKFFRNADTWGVLRDKVLPELWEAGGGRVRSWSAGCATGEEPYTLAILLLDLARSRGANADGARIDATDLDGSVLDSAREAVYRPAAFDEMPFTLTKRYVTGTDTCTVVPEVKSLVRFQRHDVLRDPAPDPPYDLIICRNVVIYFDRPTQEKLFQRFVDALAPGGYLVLGKVETLVGDVRTQLVIEDARERVYKRP